MTPAEIAERIQELISSLGGEAPTSEQIEEALGAEVFEGVGRDEYHAAMEIVYDGYGVPEPMREAGYQELDAHGDYDAGGYAQNLELIFNNDDVQNHINQGIEVEGGEAGYGEHGYTRVDDINQHNDTNVANATGEDSIAGRDQWGQFQTGDGVQVGDYNEGVVNQGDNSGQQAGEYAHADDFTTGDGNFNNEGTIDDSAVAFGGGSADNQADQIWDASTNDSYNVENVENTTDSYNEENVGNVDHDIDHTLEENVSAHIDLEHSLNQDNDGHDIDDSYNEGVELHD